MDYTLPDDGWKDSFDRLLDPKPQLRKQNIIKKDVRASFNIDSSVENSNPNILSAIECSQQNSHFLDPGDDLKLGKKRGNSISTPCAKRLSSNLFYCALSPITGLKLDGLQTVPDNHKLDRVEKIRPRTTKHVCFEVNTISPKESTDSNLHSGCTKAIPNEVRKQSRSSLFLLPGKWRKSLHNWRRTNINEAPRSLSPTQSMLPKPNTPKGLQSIHAAQRKSVYIDHDSESNKIISYEKEVLKYCAQHRPYKFGTAYASSKMMDTYKIGEGVYGEVFKYTQKNNTESSLVVKVLPIEGTSLVNGEIQKTFEQILPEIIISKVMSNLQMNQTNSTIGFVDIYNVSLVKGKYPTHLLSHWEDYDEEKESENDHPKMFTDSQLFIILELKFAGQDMSTFIFLNAEQAYYALQQVILTLAVGEAAFAFEHRDLHWGNILIEKTKNKLIDYKLNGKQLSIETKGIKTTIIDYTLSRITVDECCHYNDLSHDEELFMATGDYQYDIYRMMQAELKNNWSAYSPKTNVQWLSYVNSKLIDGVKYKSINTKAHKTHMEKLKAFNKMVLTFNSAVHCAEYFHSSY